MGNLTIANLLWLVERETGLEPEDIRLTRFQWMLTGLFASQLVRRVSPCFSVYRRLVITWLSRTAKFLACSPARSTSAKHNATTRGSSLTLASWQAKASSLR